MKEKILSTLNIHKMTEAQYNKEVSSGNADEYALYLTPDEEIDLSPYATVEEMNKKATSSDLASHTENKTNPHNVTKDQVGLGSVPNVPTNDQTPTYTDTTTFATLTSGEKLSVAFAKIKLAISRLITHIDNSENPHSVTKSQVGLGNVDNTSDANKPVSTAQNTAINNALSSAKSYTDTKVGSLPTSTVIDNKISSHNTSTTAHSDVRDLITALTTKVNNFLDVDDETTDQLSEVITLINNNKGTLESLTTSKINVSDIIDNLTTSSTSKVLSAKQGVILKGLIDALETELDSHTHAIADVTGLQTALNGKAATSHGTHVSYSTTAPLMDGTANVGSANTVARSDHKHPTDTSRAGKTDLDSHTGNTIVHITATERTNWNAAKTHADSSHAPSNAEKNQNAFSNIVVGATTVAADSATDTLTLVAGSNINLTPDATNDKVTFIVPEGTTSAKGVVQLTDSTSSTSTTTAATPNSVKSAYDLANSAKITADSKANASHTHNYAGSSSPSGSANSAVKLATARTINGVSFDGSANITLTANPTTTILSGVDLNNQKTPGFYAGGGGNNCTNKPTDVDSFGLIVFKNASGYICQLLVGGNAKTNIMYLRTCTGSAWTAWVTQYSTGNKPTASDIGAAASSHSHTTLGTASVGNMTTPIYFSGGAITACSAYAGATKVTLNGTSKAATDASFYAPTSAGTSGYILKSSGSGAPTWVQAVPIANGGTGATSVSGAIANLGAMDLTSAQSASGVKTFLNGINIGSANLKYDSSAGALVIKFS